MAKGKPRPRKNLGSKRVIDALRSDNPRGDRFYDTKVPGFGIVVYASGRKAFFIDYGERRRRRRMNIGAYGVLTHETARESASRKLRAFYEDGIDPLEEREARRAMPSFAEWVDEWLGTLEKQRRSRTVNEYRRLLEFATDEWGSRPLDKITPTDVRRSMDRFTVEVRERFVKRQLKRAKQAAMPKTPTEAALTRVEKRAAEAAEDRGVIAANRWLASVRSCFTSAVREGVIDTNPALAVELNKENPPRSRVLDDEELKRLLEAIEKEKDPHTRAAFRLLVETGARLREVLNAKWADMDLDAGTWRIPSPKAGKPQVVPLANPTLALLSDLERVGPYVVVGRKPNRPRYDLKSSWQRICERAELDDVHIHDIRRTFGLHVARKAGLHIASKLLRHSGIRITEQVYAPLGLDELRDAVEDRTRDLAKVLPFRNVSQGGE